MGILDKKIGVGQPKKIENCKVLVSNTPMDTDKIKIYGAKVKVDSLTKVAEIEAAEVKKMMDKCEKIKATPGKKALAIEGFAKALRSLPKTIAENGGYDATELVTQLRAAHVKGNKSAGLDMTSGEIGDMKQMGITESFRVKCQSLVSAAEAAEMVIRVDEVITCAPRQREDAM